MNTKPVERETSSAPPPLLDDRVGQALHQVYRYLTERAWLRQSEQSNGDGTNGDGAPAVVDLIDSIDGRNGADGTPLLYDHAIVTNAKRDSSHEGEERCE